MRKVQKLHLTCWQYILRHTKIKYWAIEFLRGMYYISAPVFLGWVNGIFTCQADYCKNLTAPSLEKLPWSSKNKIQQIWSFLQTRILGFRVSPLPVLFYHKITTIFKSLHIRWFSYNMIIIATKWLLKLKSMNISCVSYKIVYCYSWVVKTFKNIRKVAKKECILNIVYAWS